jgi:hypothetical protein
MPLITEHEELTADSPRLAVAEAGRSCVQDLPVSPRMGVICQIGCVVTVVWSVRNVLVVPLFHGCQL